MMISAWVLTVVAVVALVGWSGPAIGYAGPGGYYHYVSDVAIPHNFTLSLEEKYSKRPIYMNHYTTIGMPLIGETLEEFEKNSMKILADKSNMRILSVPSLKGCHYLLYLSKSGGQLWGTLEDGNCFGGFVPHFVGKSKIRMCVLQSQPLQFDDGTKGVLDGRFIAIPDEHGNAITYLHEECEEGIALFQSLIILPNKGTTYSGYGFSNPNTNEAFITLEFDSPNFGFFGGRPLPAIVTVQLSAFAREIRTFDSVEEYESMKEKTTCLRDGKEVDISLSSQFFGSGSFVDKEKTGYACIVGHVIETELRNNELSGESFYWALIETTGGIQIDVVIHPTLLDTYSSKPPQVGGVVRGYFWLSGLLLVDDR